MTETRLQCLSANRLGPSSPKPTCPSRITGARAEDSTVVLSYFDKRYPLNVAEWAFEHGHSDRLCRRDCDREPVMDDREPYGRLVHDIRLATKPTRRQPKAGPGSTSAVGGPQRRPA